MNSRLCAWFIAEWIVNCSLNSVRCNYIFLSHCQVFVAIIFRFLKRRVLPFSMFLIAFAIANEFLLHWNIHDSAFLLVISLHRRTISQIVLCEKHFEIKQGNLKTKRYRWLNTKACVIHHLIWADWSVRMIL